MMDLERLAAAVGAVDVVGRAPVEIVDLAYDTRLVQQGSAFFCVRGAHADGHDFAPAAVAAGAVAVVVEQAVDAAVPQIVVPDARAAMAPAAASFFGRPSEELEVVGVTGTNGKTTTSFLLFAILAAAGRRPGLIGTIEARVGGERRGVRGRRRRRSTCSASSARCSTQATAPSRWRRRRTPLRSIASTRCASQRSSSRT